MKITVIGRGNVGGGLAKRWQAAHADVIVVSVPSGAITEAVGKVTGVEGKVAIDTTNAFGSRDEQYESLAHEVKAATGGPVAKAFNINFAVLYDKIDEQSEKPGQFYAADDEARELAQQLIRDAGFEPVSIGSLENARLLEDQINFSMAVTQGGLGRHFYHYWTP